MCGRGCDAGFGVTTPRYSCFDLHGVSAASDFDSNRAAFVKHLSQEERQSPAISVWRKCPNRMVLEGIAIGRSLADNKASQIISTTNGCVKQGENGVN
jgi:hypothetical protein